MEDHAIRIMIQYRFCSRRLLFIIGIIASLVLVFQTFMLPYRNILSPVLPSLKKEEILTGESTSLEIKNLGMVSLVRDAQNSTYAKEILKEIELTDVNNVNLRASLDFKDRLQGLASTKDVVLENITDLMEDIHLNREIYLGFVESENITNVRENIVEQKDVVSAKEAKEAGNEFSFWSHNTTFLFSGGNGTVHSKVVPPLKFPFYSNNGSLKEELAENSSNHVASSSISKEHVAFSNSTELQLMGFHLNNNTVLLKNKASSFLVSDSKPPNIQPRKKRPGNLTVSVSEMKQLLLTYHSSNHKKPNSAHDKQLLAAKELLQKAPAVKIDEELYGPAFWNISEFRKSYELMERVLKIYVYKEGNKPVFHQPLLRGIYASEGWFMKLLQSDKHFVVRDHKKANLFYIPFSSRLLQLSLYDRSSHSHENLIQHLKNYVDLIAAKYPYWNRTGGADHFVAACHDWAPRITSRSMGTLIRALCNADLKRGFQLGKDVSLPEIYIRSARNPLRDLGGNSAENRSTLAFYAGNLHGRLRPILLQHWENKDPDMKILGPMPPGVESKMIYIQHMKNSRYCVCPRGYEVNSPRVVESIYYECVPVIISDNYVPPFVEALNWEAFACDNSGGRRAETEGHTAFDPGGEIQAAAAGSEERCSSTSYGTAGLRSTICFI
ncbi:putative glycosyltransferase [Platanthera zijinensis]|uniref:Glycosyltransferase n=1 Tax=Platanthera zijinensis TaxID=2320716 RepID=A0AAP0FSX4_9ASPA